MPHNSLRSVWLLTGLFVCTAGNMLAQADKHSAHHIQLDASWSYSGYSTGLSYLIKRGRSHTYLGPLWVWSDAYQLSSGPWGVQAGSRWVILSGDKLDGFMDVNFRYLFFASNQARRSHRAVEGHFSYGYLWRISPRWMLGQQLGLGFYRETFDDGPTGDRLRLDGLSVLAGLNITYRLSNEP